MKRVFYIPIFGMGLYLIVEGYLASIYNAEVKLVNNSKLFFTYHLIWFITAIIGLILTQ